MPLDHRSKLKVAVIGGGIIGLTSAVRITESLDDVEVTVIAKDLSPKTTADVSAGFWKPYLLGDVPKDIAEKWQEETFQFYVELLNTSKSGEIGLGFLTAFDLSVTGDELTPGSAQMLSYRKLNEREARSLSKGAKEGAVFTTTYTQCNRFLPYLLKRFESNGGILLEEELEDFRDLFVGGFDVVVNCTGIASAKLVPDPTVYPIRGQLVRVKAPWIKHAIMNTAYHVLPNTDYVQLGGTAQVNDWNLKEDPEDTKNILDNCCSLVPSLENAEVIEVRVGLRPARVAGPRVEKEILTSADEKQEIPIIHNYGHGGSGVTLCWGCAGTVVDLLKESCNNKQ